MKFPCNFTDIFLDAVGPSPPFFPFPSLLSYFFLTFAWITFKKEKKRNVNWNCFIWKTSRAVNPEQQRKLNKTKELTRSFFLKHLWGFKSQFFNSTFCFHRFLTFSIEKSLSENLFPWKASVKSFFLENLQLKAFSVKSFFSEKLFPWKSSNKSFSRDNKASLAIKNAMKFKQRNEINGICSRLHHQLALFSAKITHFLNL